MLEQFREAELAAKRAHAGLWIHGDPGDDSDTEEFGAPRPRR